MIGRVVWKWEDEDEDGEGLGPVWVDTFADEDPLMDAAMYRSNTTCT